MTMETIFLIVLAAFNVWTIYFYNKLLLEVANGKEKEKRHAGKVFHEMDGNQFYEKFMENSEECKKNIHDYVTFYLQTHKIVEISKPKKEFKVPDSIEDFNILDFV